ncbi:MAG: hypothetical protein WCV90_05305 [Candidatus Woesearchaeota archaeon]
MKHYYLILLLIILTSCTTIPEFDQQDIKGDNLLSELDQVYLNLQQEFEVIRTNGGAINPIRYEEIKLMIQNLEEREYSSEKINILKEEFQKFHLPKEQGAVLDDYNNSVEQTSNPAINKTPFIPPPLVEEKKCINNKYPVFTHHITDINQVTTVQTPPMIMAGHLKTHSYIDTNHNRVPIYAPVDMTLTTGSFYVGGPYGLDFQVSCEISLRFGHITEPIDEIKEVFPSTPSENSQNQEITHQISFKAGDLIAYTTGTTQAGNWDFGVYDSTTQNRYTYSKEWNTSSVYTTAVCPYDYFSSELKEQYVKRYNLVKYSGGSADGASFC